MSNCALIAKRKTEQAEVDRQRRERMALFKKPNLRMTVT